MLTSVLILTFCLIYTGFFGSLKQVLNKIEFKNQYRWKNRLIQFKILSLQNLKYFPVHYLHFFCICVTKLVENRHLHYVFKQWRGIARTEVISLRILKKSLTQNFWSVNYKNTLNISKTFCFCILKNAATCFHFHTP